MSTRIAREGGQKLRILQLVWFLHPYHFGGSGVSVFYLGTALAARGHDVHFAVLNLDPRAETGTPSCCAVHGLGAHRGWIAVGALARLARLVRRLAPDVIHAHPLAAPSVWAALLKRSLGVPFVITDRGSIYTSMAPARRLLCGWALRSADAVIALTEDMRERLRQLAPCDPEVIPSGVDAVAVGAGDPCEEEPGPVVVYGGRLEPAKGVDTLLDAFASVAGKLPNCSLHLYGDGPDASRLREKARQLNLGAHVAFRGAVPHEHFTAALRRATLLVLPSLREALPRTVLEALAAGVPVVASRVGGIPEVVTDGENGLLVPPGNADALGAALTRLLEDRKLRVSMSRANVEQAARYRWSDVARRTEAVYGRVVERAGRVEAGELHTRRT